MVKKIIIYILLYIKIKIKYRSVKKENVSKKEDILLTKSLEKTE